MKLNTKSNDPQILRAVILYKREEWRKLRTARLNKKKELLDKGQNIKEIRKENEYRGLKKVQKRLSKEIKHLEKKLNIMIARGSIK